MEEQKKTIDNKLSIMEWYEAIVFALCIVVIIFIFVIRLVMVSGPSMMSTLVDGDHLAIQSSFFSIKRGDIVVADDYIKYNKRIVKRVIGVEGDVVNIDEQAGTVSVNGQVLDEPYIESPTFLGDVKFPLTVPQDCLFLMGDNRPNSLDGRFSEIGFINEKDILGKVLFRVTPLNKFGKI